jgi:hypothetical protein
MIAPIRYPARHDRPTGPQHVSAFLPAVLARYGIVISAEELASLSAEKNNSIRTTKPRYTKPRYNESLPRNRRLHTAHLQSGAVRRQKSVQLALFPTGARMTRELAVR